MLIAQSDLNHARRLVDHEVVIERGANAAPMTGLRRSMNPWHAHPVPAMRAEALYGDRIVRCFADRPAGLHAMFERARAARGGQRGPRPRGPALDLCRGRRRSATASRPASPRAASAPATGSLMLLVEPAGVRASCCSPCSGSARSRCRSASAKQRPGLAFIAAQCGAIGIVFDDALADRVPLADEAPALARCALGGRRALADDRRPTATPPCRRARDAGARPTPR